MQTVILIGAFFPVIGSIFCRVTQVHIPCDAEEPVSGHDILRVRNMEDEFDTPVISELWKL